MRRNLLTMFAVIAVLGLAASAWGAQQYSQLDGGGGEAFLTDKDCLCKEAIPAPGVFTPVCPAPVILCGGLACTDNTGCLAGQVCVSRRSTGCPGALAGECEPITPGCAHTPETCTVASAIIAICVGGTNPGTACPIGNECLGAGGYCQGPSSHLCPSNIPTLSQWGLILFGMLLLTAMFITIRRRGLPAQMTASLLLLMAVGVIAVSVSYAKVQSNRICGETDVAVDFVNDILKG